MIVQLVLHVPFQLSLMHCELGSSKKLVTFDCISTISGIAKLVNSYCKENTSLCFGVCGARSNMPQLWALFTFFQELK